MNIIDLIKKYENDNSLEYLKSVIGDEDYIIGLFESTMNIKYIIDRIAGEYEFFSIFHRIYKEIENDSSIDNTIMNCLVILESYYDVYSKNLSKSDTIRKNCTILPNDTARIKMLTNIGNMCDINNLSNRYEYYLFAKEVTEDINDFSLEQIFNQESGFSFSEGLNGVTLITPNQTVSRLNDASINGLKGSGHHDTNFDKIEKAIYGKGFLNYTSGQDIKISYETSIESSKKLKFSMVVQVPFIINSSQKVSLMNLNEAVKKIESKLGQNINVHSVVVDYETKDYINFFENEINLDKVLNEVAVDDLMIPKHQELFFLGHDNFNNQYIKEYSYIK